MCCNIKHKPTECQASFPRITGLRIDKAKFNTGEEIEEGDLATIIAQLGEQSHEILSTREDKDTIFIKISVDGQEIGLPKAMFTKLIK